jgi:hypothetical protein
VQALQRMIDASRPLEILGEGRGTKLVHQIRGDVGCDGNYALGTRGHRFEGQIIVSGQNGGTRAYSMDEFLDSLDTAAGFFQRDDVRMRRELINDERL